MRNMVMLWEVVLATTTISTAAVDTTEITPGQGLNVAAAGLRFNNTDFLRYSSGYCSLGISCKHAGGHCVKSRGACKGTIDPKGCRGEKKCKCCIPDKSTPAVCLTCPTGTSTPCPTTGPAVSPTLNWTSVGADRFVRFTHILTWNEAYALCKSHSLDLYQPRDILAVAKYLDDNYKELFYWLGARGNGSHQVWISGDVVHQNDPWYYEERNNHTTYYNNTSTNDCLAFITTQNLYQNKTVLFALNNSCTMWTSRVICGHTVCPIPKWLKWTTVGSDRFVISSQKMNWTAAQDHCRSLCLDLYQPRDNLAVSKYLEHYHRDYYYWLGARGNGTHQVWLSGDVVPKDAPWYRDRHIYVGTLDCMQLITNSGYYEKGEVLAPYRHSCINGRSLYFLCGKINDRE